MRILYAIQGTGNGHITRGRVMANALAQHKNLTVDYYFSGRKPDKYFDMECFGDYKTAKGFTFITENGQVSNWKTLKDARVCRFLKDINNLDLSGYDLVINDFEPISSWAAKQQKVTCINISHQSSMLHPMAFANGSNLHRMMLKMFAPADIYLGVHWYHFGHQIIPPFIELNREQIVKNNSILVYMPFESLQQIKILLSSFSANDFICYHPDIKEAYQQEHILFKPLSRVTFPKDLAAAEGVMANSGFELSSEAICLGKKLLLKPLNKQFEQNFNAQTLEALGIAKVMQELDEVTTEIWLEQSSSLKVDYPQQPEKLIQWLMRGDWDNTKMLCDELWQQVKFPPQLAARLARSF